MVRKSQEKVKSKDLAYTVKDISLREADLAVALHNVINAWEELPGGNNYSVKRVEDWLRDTMVPAIEKGRYVLGRKRPG